jgi:hypothetical protein
VTYIASATLEDVKFPAVDVHDFSGPKFFYDGFSRCVIPISAEYRRSLFLTSDVIGLIIGLGMVLRQVNTQPQ